MNTKFIILLIISSFFIGCNNKTEIKKVEPKNIVPKYTNYTECTAFCHSIKARSGCYFGCKDLYREGAEEYYRIHGNY